MEEESISSYVVQRISIKCVESLDKTFDNSVFIFTPLVLRHTLFLAVNTKIVLKCKNPADSDTALR